MHRALDQRSLQIEKLMFDPVERGPGMRAAVDIGKTLAITLDDEAIDAFSIKFERESVRSGVRDPLQRANQDKFFQYLANDLSLIADNFDTANTARTQVEPRFD